MSMGKEGKSLSVSWREQSEPLSLPSVIIYRYFFYRQYRPLGTKYNICSNSVKFNTEKCYTT
jgi:hypothetical protein